MQGRSSAAQKEQKESEEVLGKSQPRFSTGVYTVTTDIFSAVCFAGASAIRATPMTTSTADPTSSPRAIKPAKACTAIRIAWTKLDHAVKAIRLRLADGLRAASSRKMPSVT